MGFIVLNCAGFSELNSESDLESDLVLNLDWCLDLEQRFSDGAHDHADAFGGDDFDGRVGFD